VRAVESELSRPWVVGEEGLARWSGFQQVVEVGPRRWRD
jgi:hypothetical protein